MRSFAAAFLVAFPVLAAVPEKGEGTITLLGGARVLVAPTNDAYINQQGATHGVFQPEGIASFGYQYDEELHFKIEVGYAADSYKLPGVTLNVKTIPILLGIDTVLMKGSWFTVYGGGAIGYSLNSANKGDKYNEANSTAFSLALGLRMKLTDKLAFVVEDRFTLARAQVDPDSTLLLNMGGNLLSIGLQFHFLEPDDKGHPHAP